ncbi:MAG: flagellar hook-associated protein FlgL [Bacteriovoracia bacterium]
MRVSDNTSKGAVGEALKRTRTKIEDLQIKNAIQKKIVRPSDDPAVNSKVMDIRTQTTTNAQFEQNGVLAKSKLSFADAALGEMVDIFVRAKEIAISQSSDASASEASRLGVAQEVAALYRQLISVANRRIGNTYLFGGYKTNTPPYTPEGEYHGDMGETPVEVQKDVYVMVNLPGPFIFEISKYRPEDNPRSPASIDKTDLSELNKFDERAEKKKMEATPPPEPLEVINAFKEIDQLRTGLLTNDTTTIRDTLDRLDEIIKNTISLRAKISGRVSGIDLSMNATQKTDVSNAEIATQLEDADYAELWSNLAKEETVLRSSLRAAQKLIQPTLLEFLR